jgi:hypothetical protein
VRGRPSCGCQVHRICLYYLLPFSLTIVVYIQKEEHLKIKEPELEKSLSLVRSLVDKQELGISDGVVRYNFVDSIYANANMDYTVGTVYLWLGANVMLEYTYDEAIDFLQRILLVHKLNC